MQSQYKKPLTTSLVVALESVFGPALLEHAGDTRFMLIGFPLSIAWCLIVVYAFQQYRRRALWFLLGAPLALFWPFGFARKVLGVARM